MWKKTAVWRRLQRTTPDRTHLWVGLKDSYIMPDGGYRLTCEWDWRIHISCLTEATDSPVSGTEGFKYHVWRRLQTHLWVGLKDSYIMSDGGYRLTCEWDWRIHISCLTEATDSPVSGTEGFIYHVWRGLQTHLWVGLKDSYIMPDGGYRLTCEWYPRHPLEVSERGAERLLCPERGRLVVIGRQVAELFQVALNTHSGREGGGGIGGISIITGVMKKIWAEESINTWY